jgi:hypothetical protein
MWQQEEGRDFPWNIMKEIKEKLKEVMEREKGRKNKVKEEQKQ